LFGNNIRNRRSKCPTRNERTRNKLELKEKQELEMR
jgi:hypothetical protein